MISYCTSALQSDYDLEEPDNPQLYWSVGLNQFGVSSPQTVGIKVSEALSESFPLILCMSDTDGITQGLEFYTPALWKSQVGTIINKSSNHNAAASLLCRPSQIYGYLGLQQDS